MLRQLQINCARREKRRGTAYLMVLGAATIVSLLGITSMMTLRVERRVVEGAIATGQAQLFAQAALQNGMQRISTDENWRTTYTSGAWLTDAPIGNGTFSLSGIDDDGILADDDRDSLVLLGTGKFGRAVQKMQLTLLAYQRPLDALETALHSGGGVVVNSSKSITVTDAPLSTNGSLTNDGTVYGNVEANQVNGVGLIVGDATVPAPAKNLPDSGVFAYYQSLATELSFNGDFDRNVLTPAVNTYNSGTNAQGVYYINTGGSDLTIRHSRIHGTLVINASERRVIIDDAALLENFKSDYPVLIVQGDLQLRLRPASYDLAEPTYDTNFNPPGAAYGGSADSDKVDAYPNEIRGLIHVTGNITFEESHRVVGGVIAGGTVTIDGGCEIVYDDALKSTPPVEYLEPPEMKISTGSLRRVVD